MGWYSPAKFFESIKPPWLPPSESRLRAQQVARCAELRDARQVRIEALRRIGYTEPEIEEDLLENAPDSFERELLFLYRVVCGG